MNDLQRMLDDIEMEFKLTRMYIGKNAMDFVGKNAIDFVGKNPSLGNAYTTKNM